MRDAFILDLLVEAKNDSDIILLSNDFGAPSLDKFRNELPNQFFNVGISEQNIISVSAGLAMCGKKVFIYSIASFIVLRSLEQLKIDICSMGLGVTIIGVGPCYGYSEDGPTHHATEDISIIRTLVNASIYSPSDCSFSKYLIKEALSERRLNYIRIDRGKLPVIYQPGFDFSMGFSLHNADSNLTVISTGIMSSRLSLIKKELDEEGFLFNFIDLFKIKPLNTEALATILSASTFIITIEEHSINGGIGSIISEIITDNSLKCILKRVAIDDSLLYSYGNREQLHKERNLDSESIKSLIKKYIK